MAHLVKDLKIQCVSNATSGTVIDTNKRTFYQVVEAAKTLKFSDFNMGSINFQVKSTSGDMVGLRRSRQVARIDRKSTCGLAAKFFIHHADR
jgi:hypothetical protein